MRDGYGLEGSLGRKWTGLEREVRFEECPGGWDEWTFDGTTWDTGMMRVEIGGFEDSLESG